MDIRMKTVLALALLPCAAVADFSYQEKTQVTGGSLLKMMRFMPGAGKLKEPIYTRVYLQQNRMARVSDLEADIIDLDKEQMMHIDLEKKTYSVITFEEFRKAMAAMAEKMSRQMGNKNEQLIADMRLSVNDGGESKVIQGLPAKLMKIHLEMDLKDQKSGQTMTTTIESDEWRTPDVAGYEQLHAFQQAFALKLGIGPEAMKTMQLAMMQPGTSEGMARLAKEAAKLQGVPLVQVTRMKGMGLDLPDINMPSGAEVGGAAAESAAGAALGRLGRLGGLGGLGRRKKQEEPPPPPKKTDEAKKGEPGVLLETTTENSNFSSGAVDAAKFSVPAGFKEVEHEMKKALREANK
jgi:hypothetical protein